MQSRGISVRARLPRDTAWMLCVPVVYLGLSFARQYGFGVDARAYWGAWQGTMYDGAATTYGAYLYSPAFAQLIWPLSFLPFMVFASVFALAAAATLWHLVSPLGWAWAVPLWLCLSYEVLSGNINWLLAVCAVYGMRYPALWAVPALTKVTPAVGPVWFLARGEWRKFSISVVAAAGVALGSFLLAPGLWAEWFAFLTASSGQAGGVLGGRVMPPPIYRVPVGLALVVWGARTDRPWTIPVAMVLSTPVFGLGSLAILAAIPRLQQRSRQERGEARSTTAPSRPTVRSIDDNAGESCMRNEGHDHNGLHVDEEKWQAWEKAKADYEDDPEGVDTSGSGRPDDGTGPHEDDPVVTGEEDPDQPVGRTDEPIDIEAAREVASSSSAEGDDEST